MKRHFGVGCVADVSEASNAMSFKVELDPPTPVYKFDTRHSTVAPARCVDATASKKAS